MHVIFKISPFCYNTYIIQKKKGNEKYNMKIIISPAKTQNGKKKINADLTEIIFKEKSEHLFSILENYSKKELSELMNIKNKLLDTTYSNFEKEDLYMAITLYNGIVFKEIDSSSYDKVHLQYLKEHLRILSAVYGVVKPFDGIRKYRLDMTMHPNNINLYNYWKDEINDYFSDELIINLASNEYSSMIEKKMINIYFKEKIDEKLKVKTVYAKKARGLMVDFMVRNTIYSLEDLKRFNEMGYQFSKEHSTENDLVFIRNEN